MKHFLRKIRYRIRLLMLTKEERRHALVGPGKLWSMKRDFQFQFLGDMGLNPEHFLFELGCGTLRGGLPIIQYLKEGHYFGVEVREKALNEGRKELRESGLASKTPILLLSSSVADLNVDRTFDFIWAFSVLIHMNDEILDDALAFVSNHLSKSGVFYANVNMGDGEEGCWQGFPVVTRTFEFYSQACAKHDLVVSDLGSLKSLGHVANIEAQDNQRMLKIVNMNGRLPEKAAQ